MTRTEMLVAAAAAVLVREPLRHTIAASRKPGYVALGDCTTIPNGYSTISYPQMLAAKYGYALNAQGIMGVGITEVMRYEVPAVGPNTRLVTLSCGINDAVFPSSHGNENKFAFLANYLAVIAAVAKVAPGASIVCSTAINNHAPGYEAGYAAATEFNEMLRKLAGTGIRLVDLDALRASGALAYPGPNMANAWHPNNAGVQIVASAFEAAL